MARTCKHGTRNDWESCAACAHEAGEALASQFDAELNARIDARIQESLPRITAALAQKTERPEADPLPQMLGSTLVPIPPGPSVTLTKEQAEQLLAGPDLPGSIGKPGPPRGGEDELTVHKKLVDDYYEWLEEKNPNFYERHQRLFRMLAMAAAETRSTALEPLEEVEANVAHVLSQLRVDQKPTAETDRHLHAAQHYLRKLRALLEQP